MATEKEKKAVIRQCDIMFWGLLFMFISMRVAAIMAFGLKTVQTGADIMAVQTAYEANPLFHALLRLRGANYILQFIVIPAIGFTLYKVFRKKVIFNNYPLDVLQHQIIFTFFIILFNFFNDVAALAAILIGG